MAKEKNVSGYALALAWRINQNGVTSPIIDPRTIEQLTDSLTALQITLTEEDMNRLNQVAPPESVTVPYIHYKSKHLFRP